MTIVIDVGARLIRLDGVEIHLAPKVFELLLTLVRNQPNAVRHEQLRATLWPGVHVSETSLSALVTQLRKALGDASGEDRLIRTVHRIGYAFSGEAVVAQDQPTRVSVCRLTWRRESFELPEGESIIGRDQRCVVRIDADSVSRQHARLSVIGRDVSIEDLGSKNGTRVAGERINGVVPLTDGTSFRLGNETVRIEIGVDERPTKTAPP